MIQHQPPQELTFATLLETLYGLAKSYCHNQVNFFAFLFHSYCKYRSDNPESVWVPTQSNVNAMLKSHHKPSRRQYDYYLNLEPHALYNDATSFAQRIAPSPALDAYYYTELLDLLEVAANIPLCDQESIKELVSAGNGDFAEMVYQLLFYLFHLPPAIAIGAE